MSFDFNVKISAYFEKKILMFADIQLTYLVYFCCPSKTFDIQIWIFQKMKKPTYKKIQMLSDLKHFLLVKYLQNPVTNLKGD